MKRPIAMKCTQEQFDSIKDRINLPIDIEGSFNQYPYLTNNYASSEEVGITSKPTINNRTVYETFNADIFLEACGIEVTNIWNAPTMEITENRVWKGSELQFKNMDGSWIDCTLKDYEFRLKPQPCSQEIESLQQKAKENGMKAVITFEKL